MNSKIDFAMPFEINHHSNPHSYVKQIGNQNANSALSWSKQLGREIVYGGFHDGPTTTEGTAASVLIGFIPIVGQIADARDTLAAIKDVALDPTSVGSWAGLGLVVVCWIPGTDALKLLKKSKKIKKVSFAKKLGRLFWEDRKTFNASRDFFKRHKWLFGKNHGWSMEHLVLKQRNYRGAEKNLWFPKGSKWNKVIQGFGDAGWNVVPIPHQLNQWLYHHPKVSTLFTAGVYTGAIGFVSASTYLGHLLGESIVGEVGNSYNEK